MVNTVSKTNMYPNLTLDTLINLLLLVPYLFSSILTNYLPNELHSDSCICFAVCSI